MSTINYKCDTCNRGIELIENSRGFTTFGNCTITKNCKGKLYVVKRNPYNVRESLPTYDKVLDNHTDRPLFFSYTQILASSTWTVKHGFTNSCVYVIFDENESVIPETEYTFTVENGVTIFHFNSDITGTVHVLTRNGGLDYNKSKISTNSSSQISFNNVLTFAIPRYITRFDSSTSPAVIPSVVPVTPTPTPTPLPTTPFDTLNKTIRIEIEVTRPNQETVTCIETLDSFISTKSAWSNWNKILIRNRKHYVVKTVSLPTLKVFSNINNIKTKIPDGTTLRITKIDYGTGSMVTIPERGLLILLSHSPYTISDKELNKLFDCGELVNTINQYMVFHEENLFVETDVIESTYPKISLSNL